MNDLGRIIAAARERAGMSQKDVAAAMCRRGVQITNQAVSKWENGTTQPGAAQFLTLCQVLEVDDVMHTFLGTERVSPFSGLNEEGRKKAEEYIDLLRRSGLYGTEPVRAVPLRSLPLYHISVSAGTGQFLDSDHYDLVEVGDEVPMNANFGVRVAGDSMEPRFIDGQVVWVHQQQTIRSGEIGIFLYDGNAYCKKFSNEDGTVRLISLNPRYAPVEIAPDRELRVFGRVVG